MKAVLVSLPGSLETDAEVTVVIPTLNRRLLLLRTLRSVLAQKGVVFRVIVVVDGGRDGSAEAVEALADQRISVLRHESPKGVSASRNRAIRQVRTPWVAFVDDDDLWAPGKLRAQLDALATRPDAEWSCVSAVHIDSEYRKRLWVWLSETVDIGDRLLARMIIPGGGSGVIARTELVRAIGGFDEKISNLADWDFYIRLGLRSPLVSVDRPLLGYYEHPGAMSLNGRRAAVEYAYLDEKYEAERAARGVILDRFEWLLYLANVAYRSRERVWALQMYGQAFRLRPRLRTIVTIVMRLLPERLRRLKGSVTQMTVPSGWSDDLTWLDRFKEESISETAMPRA